MAKTACEQEAEYLELRGHPHSARAGGMGGWPPSPAGAVPVSLITYYTGRVAPIHLPKGAPNAEASHVHRR